MMQGNKVACVVCMRAVNYYDTVQFYYGQRVCKRYWYYDWDGCQDAAYKLAYGWRPRPKPQYEWG